VVCGAEPVDPLEVMDVLGSLVEKSLVMGEEREDGTRFRMLETIREYALEKLVGRGEESATAARHCEHYFVVAKAIRDGINGAEQAQWIRRAEVDLDNIRAATALALAGGVDPILAVKFAAALQRYWDLRGRTTEGREVVRAALALPAVQSADVPHAFALYVGAALAISQSDHARAREMLERCLMLRRRLGDEENIAATLSTLALARLQAGDAAGAVEGEREALQLLRKLGHRIGEAVALLHLGQFSLWLGDDNAAHAHLEEALAIAREIGYREVEGECELVLGEVAFERGEIGEAESRFQQSLAVCREAADMQGEAKALWWLGRASMGGGDAATARARLGEALRAFQASEMREELVGCLEDHAALLASEGQSVLAARLASMAAGYRERLALVRSPRAEASWQAQLTALREALPGASFDSAWNEGKRWETDEAVRVALTSAAELTTV